jgi:hypothetical protein
MIAYLHAVVEAYESGLITPEAEHHPHHVAAPRPREP